MRMRSGARFGGVLVSLAAAAAIGPRLACQVSARDELAFRSLSLRDESGPAPPGALLAAKAQMRDLSIGPALAAVAGLSTSGWEPVARDGLGGRTRALAVSPRAPGTVLAGGAGGGMWKSVDGGASWSLVAEQLLGVAVTCIAIAPTDPDVVWVATGEGNAPDVAPRGAGIWNSTDGGASWTQLRSTATTDFAYVNRIALAADGSVLLAATGTGMWRSTDGGETFAKVAGSARARSLDVDFHPTHPSLAVAHLTDWDPALATEFSTAMFTTDGGASWTVLGAAPRTDAGQDRVELAWHRGYTGAGNGCVYALKQAGSATQLWRSLDGGASYVLVGTTGILGTEGAFAATLWIDPSDADASTSDDVVIAGGELLHRSTNGGHSFAPVSAPGLPVQAGRHLHAFVEVPGFDGRNVKAAYVASDAGVWRVDNVYAFDRLGNGWSNRNRSYAGPLLSGIAAGPSGATPVVAGAQSAGPIRCKQGSAWEVPTDLVMAGQVVCDPGTGWFYAAGAFLGVVRSTDGVAWAPLTSGLAEAGTRTAHWSAPLALGASASAGTVLYAGGARLWRATDLGSAAPAWVAVKPADAAPISAVAVDPVDPDTVWVGHGDGALFLATDARRAAPSWRRVREPGTGPLPWRMVTRITIDPRERRRVWVAFGGFAADNLWRTDDAGVSWTALRGLPAAPVRDLAVHGAHAEWLYAATEVGLLCSTDGGASWTGMASPVLGPVERLAWSGDTLLVATWGCGAFRQRLPVIASAQPVGAPCTWLGPLAGPSLAASPPVLGAACTWTLGALPWPGIATLWISAVPRLPAEISAGCFVQLDVATPCLDVATAPAGPGASAWRLDLPSDPALVGVRCMSQAAASSGSVLVLSNGVNLVLGL